MSSLTLHGPTLSPYVRKVKLILLAKGIEHSQEQTPPSQDPEFLKISPLGKIPVLLDEQGRPINDSSIIANYLEERYPENSLLPEDVYDRAQARWFEEYADSAVNPVLVFGLFGQKIIQPCFFNNPTDEAVVENALAQAPKFLEYLEKQIAGKTYFVGNKYSLADISLACTFCCLSHADFHIDAEKYPSLAAWFKGIMDRPEYQEIMAGEKAFLAQVMNKAG